MSSKGPVTEPSLQPDSTVMSQATRPTGKPTPTRTMPLSSAVAFLSTVSTTYSKQKTNKEKQKTTKTIKKTNRQKSIKAKTTPPPAQEVEQNKMNQFQGLTNKKKKTEYRP